MMRDASESETRETAPSPDSPVRARESGGAGIAWDTVRTGVGSLIDALAASRPSPGGGAAACVVGALAHALLAKAARVSLGRLERSGEGTAEARTHLADLARAANEDARALLDQAEADGEAFEAILRALRLPRGDEAERSVRAARLAQATHRALDVALTIAERLFSGLSRVEELEVRVTASIVPDVRAAHAFLAAALGVTLDNARANARDGDGRARVAELEAQARAFGVAVTAVPEDATPP